MVEATRSPRNIAIVEEAIAKRNIDLPPDAHCGCSPTDSTVRTFGGWKEAGRHVRKGEKSLCSVMTFLPEKKGDNGQVIYTKRPWIAYLFCFCQTEEEGNRKA